VLVSWTAPELEGTSAITKYVVTSKPGSFSCSTTTKLSCLVEGLSNGKSYTFTVAAFNLVGSSPLSEVSATVTPMLNEIPAPPVITDAVPGNGQIELTMEAGENGGLPDYYTVSIHSINGELTEAAKKAAKDAQTSLSDAPSASVAPNASASTSPSVSVRDSLGDKSSSSGDQPSADRADEKYACRAAKSDSCVVEKLTNEDEYTFTATATNEFGTSEPSKPSKPVRPSRSKGAPDAPKVYDILVGNQQVRVAAEVDTELSPDADTFTITATPGGAACVMDSREDSCLIGGLINGTSYSFTARAKNDFGISKESKPSDSVTPSVEAGLPSPPVVTSLEGAAGLVKVSVAASAGGHPKQYRISASPGGQDCVTSSGTCLISGLENGSPYTFVATAINRWGESSASAPSAAVTPETPFTVPESPEIASIVEASTSVDVTVTPGGGFAATSFTIKASPGGASCTTSKRSCTITGLTQGTPYYFTVVATNSAGNSAASGASRTVTLGPAKAA